jgi:hypothetical protein
MYIHITHSVSEFQKLQQTQGIMNIAVFERMKNQTEIQWLDASIEGKMRTSG